jgi:O-antigen/teichoic acid export membrane protein
MLHYGVRVQVGNWSNAASLRLDQLLLSLFAVPATLGLYVVAVSYANILLTIPHSAAMVMLPEIVERHAAGGARECLQRWYRRLLWATVLGAIAIGLLGVIIVPGVRQRLPGSRSAACRPDASRTDAGNDRDPVDGVPRHRPAGHHQQG